MSKESDSGRGPRPPSHKPAPGYTRVLLKITGETFDSPARLKSVGKEIAAAARNGCEIAIVVGGGNIIRGGRTRLIERIPADYAGMVATIVNGIILQQLVAQQIPCEHFSAFKIAGFVPRYAIPAVRAALADKKIVVLSGGTGNPLFSTDTAAVLRAQEIGAQVILKGTKVNGVYSADPERTRNARFCPELTYEQAIERRLQVMDATAFALGTVNRIPIRVFNLFRPGNLARVIKGEPIGSIVC